MIGLHTRLAIDNTKNAADHDKSAAIADVLALSTPGGGDSSGLALIDSGTISSPAAWIGFPEAGILLPVGYQQFILFYQGIVFSASNFLAAAFSLDDGATFVCDALNFDSYSTNSAGSASLDSLMGDVNEGSAGAYCGSWLIDPGSSSIFASISGDINANEVAGNKYIILRSMINPAATIPATAARATTLRIVPDGNGDCDPPTSGINVIAGSWSLYGVPAP